MAWGSVYLQSDHYDMEDGQKICRGNHFGNALLELKEGMRPKCYGVVTGMSRSLQACKRFARTGDREGSMTIDDVPAVLFVSKREFEKENPGAVEVEYEEEWLRDNPDIVEALMNICPDTRDMSDKIYSAKVNSNEWEVVVRAKRSELPKYYPNINIYTEIDHLKRMGMTVPYSPTLKNAAPLMEKFTQDVEERLAKEEVADIIEGHMKVGVFLCQSTSNLMSEEESKCALFDTIYVEGKAPHD